MSIPNLSSLCPTKSPNRTKPNQPSPPLSVFGRYVRSEPNAQTKPLLPPFVCFRSICPTRGRLARSWQRADCPCHHGHPRPHKKNATEQKTETPSGESVAAQQVRCCPSERTGQLYPVTCMPGRLRPIVVVAAIQHSGRKYKDRSCMNITTKKVFNFTSRAVYPYLRWYFTAVFFSRVPHSFSIESTMMWSRAFFHECPSRPQTARTLVTVDRRLLANLSVTLGRDCRSRAVTRSIDLLIARRRSCTERF